MGSPLLSSRECWHGQGCPAAARANEAIMARSPVTWRQSRPWARRPLQPAPHPPLPCQSQASVGRQRGAGQARQGAVRLVSRSGVRQGEVAHRGPPLCCVPATALALTGALLPADVVVAAPSAAAPAPAACALDPLPSAGAAQVCHCMGVQGAAWWAVGGGRFGGGRLVVGRWAWQAAAWRVGGANRQPACTTGGQVGSIFGVQAADACCGWPPAAPKSWKLRLPLAATCCLCNTLAVVAPPQRSTQRTLATKRRISVM